MTKNGHRLTGLRAFAALTDLGLSSIAAGVLARRWPVVRMLETLNQLTLEWAAEPVTLARTAQ